MLLCDDTLAEDRNWPLGIFTAVHPGPDNLVRFVEVKVRGKHYTRSIHRLVRLPASHSVHGGRMSRTLVLEKQKLKLEVY